MSTPGCICGTMATASDHSHAGVLPPPEPNTIDVIMKDYLYVPQDIEVTPGTIVRWINQDVDAHDTVSGDPFQQSGDGLWESEYLAIDQTFSFTFTDDSFERFDYFCSLHGGMFGSVTVVEAIVPEPSALGTVITILLGSTLRRTSPF